MRSSRSMTEYEGRVSISLVAQGAPKPVVIRNSDLAVLPPRPSLHRLKSTPIFREADLVHDPRVDFRSLGLRATAIPTCAAPSTTK